MNTYSDQDLANKSVSSAGKLSGQVNSNEPVSLFEDNRSVSKQEVRLHKMANPLHSDTYPARLHTTSGSVAYASPPIQKKVAHGEVIQRKWDKTDPRRWVWDGVPGITTADIEEAENAGVEWYDPYAGQAKRTGGGGFFRKGGTDRMVTQDGTNYTQKGDEFDPEEAQDTVSYFGGRVQVHHRGSDIEQQSEGAIFPPAYQGPLQPPSRKAPQQSLAWLQGLEGQGTSRRNESSVMGGSAREEMQNFGLPDREYAPWAHIRPDHTRPPDREDQSLRHPSTESANMRHSAVEQGIKMFVEAYGDTPVGRRLYGQVDSDSMLYTNMLMQVGIIGSDDITILSHDQPFFSEVGGRSGDGTAIFKFLETEYFKEMTRMVGFGSELGEDSYDDMSDEETGDDILSDWPEQAANQVLVNNITNADELRLAANQLFGAIESALEINPRLEEVTSDFVSETVSAYAGNTGLNNELSEILDFLVAELVYDEDYSEALEELREHPAYRDYIIDLQR
ncbi:MAG: hypothetical protein FH748_09125 [Balneolaceae bacterium]|nr:hypothetical protein [Balneolaceae bacterium]